MTQDQWMKNLSVPSQKIDAILDTDAYNEIDDQFALAYMLRSADRINTKAIYAAPFLNQKSVSPKDGMEKSFNEILKVLDLADRNDLATNTFKGSETYLPNEKTPVISPAAEHLVNLSMHYSTENPLYVISIGAITNVASALLINPQIKENIVVIWLGGNSNDANEFNMCQDIAAARVVFGCGVPLVELPCAGVVEMFSTTGPELEHWLIGKNKLSDYLAKNVIFEAESYAKGKPWSRVIWDVTAVAWLLNDNQRFMREHFEHSKIPEYDLCYASDKTRHFIKVVYHINRDCLFEDLFNKLTE